MKQRGGACLVALSTLLSLAACSGEPGATIPEGPYAEDFAIAWEFATSDFERRVLADGVITEEEYDEAHFLWLACMEEHFPPGSNHAVGLEKNRENGLYSFLLSSPPGVDTGDRYDEFNLLYDACSEGTIWHIAGIYNSMTTNPGRVSYEEFVYDCFLDRGMIPDGYTVEDFTDDLEAFENELPQSDRSPLKGWPDEPDSRGCF